MGDQGLPNIRLSIECTVCFEIFKRPKVLTCGHSFCLVCLQQMERVGRGSFDCPVCRKQHDLGKQGVEGLRDNFALISIVDSLRGTLGVNTPAEPQPQPANVATTRRVEAAPAGVGGGAPKETEKKVPNCVRHPGVKLEASCEQCEDTVCRECIATKCRRQNHKVTPVKEKAALIRVQLKLLLLGAAFSNLKDNMTLGQGLVEGGKVVEQAEKVRLKIFAAHDRALTFAEQRKKQYLEIIEGGTQEGGNIGTDVHLQILQRAHTRLTELSNVSSASTGTVGRDVMQDIVSNARLAVKDSKTAIRNAEPSGCSFEFIGYPPDGSVGELVYDTSSTIGVLSLSGGRLIIARDDRRVAGVCIGEVYQDRPADVVWLFTLKPANYISNVIFCTLSLRSDISEPDQNILIAVGQEIYIIDVNSSKYPTSENRCPAQGIKTICPKSMPKNATITGIDWYPVPLSNAGGFGFSTEFVIYTTNKCHDLTVVSTTTGLNVRVISSSIYLSLIRCNIVNNDVAMLVKDSSQARVLMIDTNGNVKHSFKAPSGKPDANPTLLCWVENPVITAAVLWVPVQMRGWEIVLYNATTGSVMKTIHGNGETPTGLDGLLPDKMVMCFNDGGVRICNITMTRIGSCAN
ncbi:uncharacterized protein [Apostichopus japonicus]|uniref:uncharacterized protein n=1 Tax=Stichopus japonicus TaxID=307972 RepID=UPI003AB3CD5D